MNDEPIQCMLCGGQTHVMKAHLEREHDGMTVAEYQQAHPDAPLLSDKAKAHLEERRKKASKSTMTAGRKTSERPLTEVFGIPESTAGVKTKSGKLVQCSVLEETPEGYEDLVPDKDTNYIFNVEYLRTAMMGLKYNIPTYLVGHAGTGKSTLFEQICAFTNRATLRIQHTVNTEEAHVLGQYIVKGGDTVWEPGPLALCMKHGIAYLADEYDRAMPQVLSVYQPVLEGKALVTKEAPPEWRIIKPHPDFRFIATGNTNGAGDETGLYPSTALQDFANYERFGIMLKIDWMPKDQEQAIIVAQTGVPKEFAENLVRFATDVRREFDGGGVSAPISPRALINAAKLGLRMGDFRKGIGLAFLNRLTTTDREVCDSHAQRIFG